MLTDNERGETMFKMQFKPFIKIIAGIVVFSFIGLAQAKVELVQSKESKDKQQIIDFVNKAQKYIENNGKKNAFAEFDKKSGKFTEGDRYIFAVDYNGTFLAGPNYSDLNGSNQINFKDTSGNLAVQKEIELAKSGGGWIKGRWKNPLTGKNECKESYIQPMKEDYLIGSGYYYPEDSKGNCQ